MTLLKEAVRSERLRIQSGALRRILWIRKAYHVGNGLVCMWLAIHLTQPQRIELAVVCLLVCLIFEGWRLRDRRVHPQLVKVGLARRQERHQPSGNLWMCLAMLVVTTQFKDPLVVSGCLVGWTFGDPAAEIGGRLICSPRFRGRRKTLAGAAVCMLVSVAAYAVFFRQLGVPINAVGIVAVSAVTAVGETFSGKIDDNLTIPILCALTLSYFF
ncbi:MAG: hypothetical protein HY420_00560 [Candidatus Kerfeldbacteria bacterium]|nr:hypothetical protein [Candidatus Kerfeldbacteria bacterium]